MHVNMKLMRIKDLHMYVLTYKPKMNGLNIAVCKRAIEMGEHNLTIQCKLELHWNRSLCNLHNFRLLRSRLEKLESNELELFPIWLFNIASKFQSVFKLLVSSQTNSTAEGFLDFLSLIFQHEIFKVFFSTETYRQCDQEPILRLLNLQLQRQRCSRLVRFT
jgi:hypothetical protein